MKWSVVIDKSQSSGLEILWLYRSDVEEDVPLTGMRYWLRV